MSATNNILLIGKHFSVFFFCWFSLRFREITYAKTLSLVVAFFAVLLLRDKQKKPFVSTKNPFVCPTFFCIHYFLKTKRKRTKKKKYREMFSYPFVAHISGLNHTINEEHHTFVSASTAKLDVLIKKKSVNIIFYLIDEFW